MQGLYMKNMPDLVPVQPQTPDGTDIKKNYRNKSGGGLR